MSKEAEKTKGTITTDPEIRALSRIDRILQELPEADSRLRVVSWLMGKYTKCNGATKEKQL